MTKNGSPTPGMFYCARGEESARKTAPLSSDETPTPDAPGSKSEFPSRFGPKTAQTDEETKTVINRNDVRGIYPYELALLKRLQQRNQTSWDLYVHMCSITPNKYASGKPRSPIKQSSITSGLGFLRRKGLCRETEERRIGGTNVKLVVNEITLRGKELIAALHVQESEHYVGGFHILTPKTDLDRLTAARRKRQAVAMMRKEASANPKPEVQPAQSPPLSSAAPTPSQVVNKYPTALPVAMELAQTLETSERDVAFTGVARLAITKMSPAARVEFITELVEAL